MIHKESGFQILYFGYLQIPRIQNRSIKGPYLEDDSTHYTNIYEQIIHSNRKYKYFINLYIQKSLFLAGLCRHLDSLSAFYVGFEFYGCKEMDKPLYK